MNEQELKNLKLLVSNIDCICLNAQDYARNEMKNIFEPFYSDQMWEVVKRGCIGRFKHSEKCWAGHCFLRKNTKPGHFRILLGNQDPNNAIWGEPKWSKNISLSDDKVVLKAIATVQKFNNLKAFW